MKLLFDGRVLRHKHMTGVQVFTKSLYEELSNMSTLSLALPFSHNAYLQHLWEHLMLPLKALRYDVLYCPANIAPFWLPKKVKLVVTLHDVAFLSYPKSVSKVFGLYYRWIVPKILKRANGVVTLSNASRQEILSYFPYVAEKLHVIYNGINEQFHPIEDHQKTNTILYVGSLQERKNFITVVKAFECLQAITTEYRLVIIGKFSDIFHLTDESLEVLKKARQNPQIDFIDFVSFEELQTYYAHAKLFLFPSLYEGFGFPPLEAMACGTPTLVSKCSSLPEICEDAAVYIDDPLNIHEVTSKMMTILSSTSLQKELIEKGIVHARKFTWFETAHAYQKIFIEVLK